VGGETPTMRWRQCGEEEEELGVLLLRSEEEEGEEEGEERCIHRPHLLQ